jgi:SAM-dependent methyltransferase
MPRELKNTGERVIPEAYGDSPASHFIYLTHRVAYRFCTPFVADRRVLDFGCGTGHGTAEMAARCAEAVGVDVSPEAIEHARSRYASPKVRFAVISKVEWAPLPFEDRSFDVVVSVQVIEHLRDPVAYLAEAKRVLEPGGVLVVATPDRTTRLFPGQRPWNRFHVDEFSAETLEVLLSGSFRDVEVLRMSATPALAAMELERTRRLKWLTLPFTFPGAPDWYRRGGLALLSGVEGGRSRRRGRAAAAPRAGEDDVAIGKDLSPSINLVAVARA